MTNTVDHKREDYVVDRFSRRLHKRFGEVFSRNEEHPNFAATPLGGQDKALADYLLAGKGRYCLIEFKADEDAALAETKKPLRHALCRTFQKRAATMARAEDIHFIGWGTKQELRAPSLPQPETLLGVSLSAYPGKVCPLIGHNVRASAFETMTQDAFIDKFIDGEVVGSDAKRFDKYVGELFKLAETDEKNGKDGFQGTVYVFVPPSDGAPAELLSIEFTGIEHLFRLTKELAVSREKSKVKDREKTKDNDLGKGFGR